MESYPFFRLFLYIPTDSSSLIGLINGMGAYENGAHEKWSNSVTIRIMHMLYMSLIGLFPSIVYLLVLMF